MQVPPVLEILQENVALRRELLIIAQAAGPAVQRADLILLQLDRNAAQLDLARYLEQKKQ